MLFRPNQSLSNVICSKCLFPIAADISRPALESSCEVAERRHRCICFSLPCCRSCHHPARDQTADRFYLWLQINYNTMRVSWVLMTSVSMFQTWHLIFHLQSRARQEDPEQARLKQKAKEVQLTCWLWWSSLCMDIKQTYTEYSCAASCSSKPCSPTCQLQQLLKRAG